MANGAPRCEPMSPAIKVWVVEEQPRITENQRRLWRWKHQESYGLMVISIDNLFYGFGFVNDSGEWITVKSCDATES